MLIILLKSSICLAILIAFYKLALENLSIHKFKRFYLLGAILISATIPFITFVEYIEPQTVLSSFEATNNSAAELLTPSTVINEQTTNYLPLLLWSIYGLGVVLFGIKFCINLFNLVIKINKNEKQHQDQFITVLLDGYVSPHTFFNYIFLNKTAFKSKTIPQEVLLHEKAHARQKHSLDILFIELLQVFFWFNPLIYFTKKAIKLNHEFLADRAVINLGKDSSTYQHILLSFTANTSEPKLAHGINYSSIKKRFTVMKTQTSQKAIWLRSLLVLPVLGLLLFSFSTTKVLEKESSNTLSLEDPISLQANSNTQKTMLTVNNVACETGLVRLSKKEFKNMVLGTSTGDKILSFKYKVVGEPVVTCKGNKLNAKAKDLLSDSNNLGPIQLFDIQTKKDRLDPVIVQLLRQTNSRSSSTNTTYSTIINDEEESLGNARARASRKSSTPLPPKSPPGSIHQEEEEHINSTNSRAAGRRNVPVPSRPKSPIDLIVSMAKKDATFYYNDEKISSDKAIAIIKKKPNLNISAQSHNGQSVVHLSEGGITVVNGKSVKPTLLKVKGKTVIDKKN